MESMVFYIIHLSKTTHLFLTIESTMLHTHNYMYNGQSLSLPIYAATSSVGAGGLHG